MQFNERGRYRKGGPLKLEQCKLLEMVQYACEVENRDDPRGRVVCKPLVRLFRRWVGKKNPSVVEECVLADLI